MVTIWQGATSLSLLSQEPADISCSGQLTTTYIVIWDPSRLEMEAVCLLAITRWWDIGVTSQCKISAVSEGQPGLARLGQGEESELASLKCSSRTELGEEVTLVTTIQSSPALGLTSVHDIEIGNNLLSLLRVVTPRTGSGSRMTSSLVTSHFCLAGKLI